MALEIFQETNENGSYLGLVRGLDHDGQVDPARIVPGVRADLDPELPEDEALALAYGEIERNLQAINRRRRVAAGIATAGAVSLVVAVVGVAAKAIGPNEDITTAVSDVNRAPFADEVTSGQKTPSKKPSPKPSIVTITPEPTIKTLRPEVIKITPDPVTKTLKPEVITVTPPPITKTDRPDVIHVTPEAIQEEGCYIVYTSSTGDGQVEVACPKEITQSLDEARNPDVPELLEEVASALDVDAIFGDDPSPSPSESPSEEPSPSDNPSEQPSPSPSETPDPSPEEPEKKFLLDAKVLEANALGHGHTAANGNKPGMENGPARTRLLMEFIRSRNVTVGALQEFEEPQRDAFTDLADKDYDFWPNDGRDARNSVFWDTTKFDFVDAWKVDLPYFNGKMNGYPFVRLEVRGDDNTEKGQQIIVISGHLPASVARVGNQEQERDRATRLLLSAIDAAHERYKLPILLLLDANERDEFYCKATESGLLEAASGGENGPDQTCSPPKVVNIDQTFGSQVDFEDYTSHGGGIVDRLTDHSNIYTVKATISNPDY